MINKLWKTNKPLKNKIKTIISGWALLSALIVWNPSFAQSTQNNKNQVTTEINIQQENHGLKQMKEWLEKNADKEWIPGSEIFKKMLEEYTKKIENSKFIAMLMVINYIYEDKTLTEEQKFAYAVFFAGSGEYSDRLMSKIDMDKRMTFVAKESEFESLAINKELEQANKELEQANKELEQANKELEQADKELEQANKELEQANKELEQAEREHNLLKKLLWE